jgi:lipopolysaccharide assembly outer membrane protein LptD (OstA)
MLLWGGVKVILEKGKALFREETLKKLRNPEVKELVKEKTLVSAQQISFSIANSNAQVQGSVEVSQKGKEAKAEEALYDDLNETLALSGNVFLKKGEVWVKCKRVLVSIPKETFEAEEVGEAKLKL